MLQGTGVRQQQLRTAVLHHVKQAITRVFDIQRHVDTTGFHHRKKRHHALGTARHGNRHAHFGADASGDQGMCEAVGLAVQLAIAQGLRIELHRHRIGVFSRAVGEQFMDQARGREARVGAIPQLENVLLLVTVQQVQLTNVLLLIGNHRLQEVLPMPRHALNGGSVEQVSGVAQRGAQCVLGLFDIEGQVKLRNRLIPADRTDLQLFQAPQMPARQADMVVERDLEQRAQAQAALRLQRFHQLLERQVLMSLGLQRTLLDLSEQLGNGGLPVDIGLEHLGIDEETDQPLGFDPVTVGDRHTHANILLAAVAMQQRLVGRQQQHEQRHAFALGQGLEAVEQRRRQWHVQPCPAMSRHRGPLVIEWQLKHRLFAAEQFTPIVKLTRGLPRFHPLALPRGVVGVLDRQRRQLQRLPLAIGGVELYPFIDHHLHRPAIGNDVVLHQHQHMLIRGQAQQADAHQRALAQVERLGDAGFYQRLQVRLIRFGQADFNA
ncbi:hypothetical protein [Pseudomonas sp. 35 E 8]|nr:hypothetical protein [Pseudomonas sp. 35 E 8]